MSLVRQPIQPEGTNGMGESLFHMIGLPEAFGNVLLLLSFALLISPYFSGTDFGAFKVPSFTPVRNKKLKRIGPVIFVVCVFLFIPIWRTGQSETRPPSVHKPSEQKSKVPGSSPVTNRSSPAIDRPKGDGVSVVILSPSEDDPIIVKAKETLMIRGELRKVRQESLAYLVSRASIDVEVKDPNSGEPIRKSLVVPPSLEWKAEFVTLPPGSRDIQVDVTLRDGDGNTVSHATTIVTLTKKEE